MAHTVVGVYDNSIQAREALNELVSSGFPLDRVRLSPEEDTSKAREEALERDKQEKGGIAGTILGLFRSFLGSPEKYSHEDIYSEAVRRGSHVLAVQTDSPKESDRATDIMNRYEPVNIEERMSSWESQGWSQYDASAPVLSDAEVQQERSQYASGAAAQKAEASAAQDEVQLSNGVVQRGGIRIFHRVTDTPINESVQLHEEQFLIEQDLPDGTIAEAPAVTGTGTAGDDSDFRSHWQSTYGAGGERYEDYAPAYQYGYKTAGDERFKNSRWADAEPEVQRDWEAKNTDHPWDRFKEAIRYGWEKLTRTR